MSDAAYPEGRPALRAARVGVVGALGLVMVVAVVALVWFSNVMGDHTDPAALEQIKGDPMVGYRPPLATSTLVRIDRDALVRPDIPEPATATREYAVPAADGAAALVAAVAAASRSGWTMGRVPARMPSSASPPRTPVDVQGHRDHPGPYGLALSISLAAGGSADPIPRGHLVLTIDVETRGIVMPAAVMRAAEAARRSTP